MAARKREPRFKDGFVKARGIRERVYDDVTVLFLDVVSFSLLTHSGAMISTVQSLQRAIHSVLDPHFYWDERGKTNEIITIPTGDGYAVAFHPAVDRTNVLTRVDEIYHKLTREEKLNIRFGISRGTHVVFVDLNDTLNLIGSGIIRAQRAMTIAEANQILCTAEFVDGLEPMPPATFNALAGRWRVKHEQPFQLYSYISAFGKKQAVVGKNAIPDARFQSV